MTDQTMDAETVEKLREGLHTIKGRNARTVSAGIADDLLALLPPQPQPQPEPAPGPYRALHNSMGWFILDANGHTLARDLDEPTARLLANSPTEAKAARGLLYMVRSMLRARCRNDCDKEAHRIDAFFAEYGNSTQDENP